MKLANKVAIVTGAGRGIGRAIALAFAQEGANLALVARTRTELEETAHDIEKLSISKPPLLLQKDVSKETDVADIIKSTVQKYGTITILVNNAAILGPIGPLVQNDLDQWVKTMQINLFGTFLCCKYVLPVMISAGKGKIVNLSGGGVTAPRPGFSAYASSKSAVVGLTSTLAEEVKKFNIQVNAIAPGAIYSRMHEQVLESGTIAGEKEVSISRQAKETGGASIDNVKALSVFLASDDSDGLTGRLISAAWDNLQTISRDKTAIMSSSIYTMKRIDNFMFLEAKNRGS